VIVLLRCDNTDRIDDRDNPAALAYIHNHDNTNQIPSCCRMNSLYPWMQSTEMVWDLNTAKPESSSKH
jgi:hypothetical protein